MPFIRQRVERWSRAKPAGRIEQVRRDVHWWVAPKLGMVELCATAQYEYRPASCGLTGGNVGWRIANHICRGKIHLMFPGQIEQHARPGFSAAAGFLRPMRAETHPGDDGAVRCRDADHTPMDLRQGRTRHQAAVDSGLVGDNKDTKAVFGQQAQPFERSGQPAELIPGLHVVNAVLIDDAVSVQKHVSPSRRRL